MSHVLVVDDDNDAARMMAALITKRQFTVATANTLRDARRQIALQRPDLLLLDLQLPDGSGMELLNSPELTAHSQVVLMTGHASLESSIQALRLGAADYLTKPVSLRQLEGVLSRVIQPAVLRTELSELQQEWERSGHFGRLVGRSTAMQRIHRQVARVAGTSISVFITGESGSGKEVVARLVHDLSRRRTQEMLSVNCGALSPQLVESEIFGHEKGSFTGADSTHQGFFERANGGTLFLDEITEMPLDLQVKLLRVLETGSFLRVGSTQPRETDVRIIAATNRDPELAVAQGRLREDLFYRLNVFPIDLPPLRERSDDVPLLAAHFLESISQREGMTRRLTPAAIERLTSYRWPGNVRELRNVVQRAYVMADDTSITEEWLPRNAGIPVGVSRGNAAPATSEPTVAVPLGSTLAESERLVIVANLEFFKGNKERTAATLGISMKTLYNRLRDYARERSSTQALESSGGDELPDTEPQALDP
ncbi:MAG TPA: sigma-54 dependent transcriptional regulator [Rubrivivax sp.]|nr:sigma-54 dependent transcriptional regulator [Rubrivivax sp.]